LPTLDPSKSPTRSPTILSSERPTTSPTGEPSLLPSELPSVSPSQFPSVEPSVSALPTFGPSESSASPTTAPTRSPSSEPTMQPSLVPSASAEPTSKPSDFPNQPTVQPFATPSSDPSHVPSVIQVTPSVPPEVSVEPSSLTAILTSEQPSKAPIRTPTDSPTAVPTLIASELPSEAPIPNMTMINCGSSESYLAKNGDTFLADVFYLDTLSVEGYDRAIIQDTRDKELYKHWREGPLIEYQIPLQPGEYLVTLFFAENAVQSDNARVFDVFIEKKIFLQQFDIYRDAEGWKRAIQLDTVVEVLDGYLNVRCVSVAGNAIIHGIDVRINGPHVAHAVPGGPYVAVDVNNDGFGLVPVRGTDSHTHALGARLTQWNWLVNGIVEASGEETSLSLPVGEHVVVLSVIDDQGNVGDDFTQVVVVESGFPTVEDIGPRSGNVVGGTPVTIKGSGFMYDETETVVIIGDVNLTGPSEITVVDETTIKVAATPAFQLALEREMKVITPRGSSNSDFFSYVSETPIEFDTGTLAEVDGPTCLAFGPDSCLYVGTNKGNVLKFEINDDGTATKVLETTIIAATESTEFRSIRGIAFDPTDISDPPDVYLSHSGIFHGSSSAYEDPAINGKISVLKGVNLDMKDDVVTGLPVSDHDHSVNGIQFNDNGDLFIQVGGNTNSGVPGLLSSSGLQGENIIGSATLVAKLSDASFNGTIEYTSTGKMVPNDGIMVFATGERNSYDLVFHSNGNIYATDNGPSAGLGGESVTCTTQHRGRNFPDKLNLLLQGGFYGHPNRARGECTFFSGPQSHSSYIAPIAELPSSSFGIAEFVTNHFGQQLKGDLIIGKSKGPLMRVILSNQGDRVAFGPGSLVSEGGMAVTQGPDGTLFVAQYESNRLVYHRPVERESNATSLLSCFPRRGAGGTQLWLYGQNFGDSPVVTVGDSDCNVTQITNETVVCTLPHAPPGRVSVVVSSDSTASTLEDGFTYVASRMFLPPSNVTVPQKLAGITASSSSSSSQLP